MFTPPDSPHRASQLRICLELHEHLIQQRVSATPALIHTGHSRGETGDLGVCGLNNRYLREAHLCLLAHCLEQRSREKYPGANPPSFSHEPPRLGRIACFLRFGLAAVIATAHDILITLGFLALFRVEIALPTVAAILTIVGYSLNDTIVVFDRVRENLNAKGGRRQDPVDLLNRSINETLPRTVLTSGTTLAVLGALLAVGGAVIRDFTVVLMLGVAIGTYSSIFVASPALLEIQKRFGDGTARRERKKRRAQVTT